MNTEVRVAVASRSFSKNQILKDELLKKFSRVQFNSEGLKLEGSSLVEFLKGHERAIIGLEKVTDQVLEKLPDLKLIAKYGVGLDNIDLAAAKRRGIRLAWQGGVNRRSVSELALCFSILLLRRLGFANQEVRSDRWKQIIGDQLTGKTVGVVGLGNVGKDFVILLQPFQCQILAHDLIQFPEFADRYRVEQVSLEKLLRVSDLVSLHIPCDEGTRGMIDHERMSSMKRGAFLVNTARGGIVDEHALKQFLVSGHLGGAAFDVFSNEPPQDAELLNLPNFFATPHIGGSAVEAILAMGRAAIEGLGL